jgi:hypothetical protein
MKGKKVDEHGLLWAKRRAGIGRPGALRNFAGLFPSGNVCNFCHPNSPRSPSPPSTSHYPQFPSSPSPTLYEQLSRGLCWPESFSRSLHHESRPAGQMPVLQLYSGCSPDRRSRASTPIPRLTCAIVEPETEIPQCQGREHADARSDRA